jgi:glycosyltransferase involved in cell wall biosynthesis
VLNKRTACFAESLRDSGLDPVILAFPRRRWDISAIEDPALDGTPGFATLRSAGPRHRRFDRPALIVCMHWSLLPLAVVLRRWFQVPLVYDEHDHNELLALEASGPAWANRARSRLVRRVHSWFLPRADVVTCIHLAGGQLKEILETRATTVIELHNYTARRWTAGPRDRSRPVESIAIIYVGGIWEEKGCAHMLDAYLRLAGDPSLPELTLHAFGTGDPEIERRLSESTGVTFHGPTPSDEILTFMASHDCLGLVLLDATPRYTMVSTNCRKLYEYLAMGVAVLATDVGDLAEIVSATEGGWTITPGYDAEGLARTIRQIVAQPQEVRRRGDAAAASVERDSWWWEDEWAKVERSGVLERARTSLPAGSRV